MDEELIKELKDQAIAAFSKGVAHDFNNILSNIMGCVSLAKHMSNGNEGLSARLLDIEDAVLRGGEFTLRLASIGETDTTLKCRTFAASLIKNIIQTTQWPDGARIEFECKNDLPQIEAEESTLVPAIKELILNSAEACQQGVIKITVRTVLICEDNGLFLKQYPYVKITIEDSGPPLSAQELLKVFDPYQNPRSRIKGLGPATSYSVIKEHNGRITVESDGLKGAAFHILFPACLEEASEEKNDRSRRAPNVLVMDDEKVVRELLYEVLSSMDYNVTLASDGKEAVSLYKEAFAAGHPFDAVILDLTVPGGVDGKAVLKELLEVCPSIKAIASSGNPAEMKGFSAHGFRAAIAKPYNLANMTSLLKNLIEEKSPV
ncbi:MAG: response regulator [Deltaproteobacteria bacterium]|nr:response regulator [Deltaproteobacteria bacterium]